MTLNFSQVPSFTGLDSINYIICDNSICDTAVLLLDVLSYGEAEPLGNVEILMYNVLSPNDDGKHEFIKYFFIKPDGEQVNVITSEFLVFNRAGEIVFRNNAYDWTDERTRFSGRYKDSGNLLPVGSYFYTVNLDESWGSGEFTGLIQIKY